MRRWIRGLLGALAALALVQAQAQDAPLLTEKKVFELPSYTTVGGRTIKQVRVGYETYGRLNAAGDNAVFIAHFYSGTSHAAGRYKPSDAAPGYWDAIIGPGKPIDTNRFFVVSADTLSNLNTKDPNVTTTGPSSIDPDTGKPYGMRFPVVTGRDFVRVHRALVDSLGVKKLRAVTGASGGAVQAMEWAASYPDLVERAIPVIGPGLDMPPYVIAQLDTWYAPIMIDPRWAGGDYYGREAPLQGLTVALQTLTISTLHYGWAERTHGFKWADPARTPGDAVGNPFSVQAAVASMAAARAKLYDANSVICLSKAYQLYDLGKDVARVKARVLFVPAKGDLLFPPALSHRAAERLRAQGNQAEVFEIPGDGGHLDGILQIGRASDAIRAFMEK